MMPLLVKLQEILKSSIDIPESRRTIFYKTKPGEYASHDQFMGIKNPTLRSIAKTFDDLSLNELKNLIESPYNEERLLALFILIKQYQSSEKTAQEDIYQFYLKNIKHVNNWNLVDASAHNIIGAHLINKPKDLLFDLAQSTNIWERRIAIVATWYFIRHGDTLHTVKIAECLLNDKHDLMHKAVGWMLREAGKKDLSVLIKFLNQYASSMPRTMLRYAIEKLKPSEKSYYMNL